MGSQVQFIFQRIHTRKMTIGAVIISVFIGLSCVTASEANIFSAGTRFSGWYDAPVGSGSGRTEFTATVETFEESTGAWTARGTDKQGDFTLKVKVEGSDVSFVKDFTAAGGYKNIKYSGTVENDEVKGDYHFVYKALFINLPVNENFYMKVTN